MSETPISVGHAERVREQLAAVNRRDIDTVLSVCAPNLIYDTAPSGMGTYEGHDAVRAFIEDYWRLFDELRFEEESVTDLATWVTLSINRQHGRPVGSTAAVQVREAHVIEWADDKIVRVTVYNDVGEARRVAQSLAASRG
jgi:ketosteroid isomerase-like protein